MGDLNNKILSSQVQVSGYRVQPYKPYTDTTAFGRGNLSPFMNAPAVADVALSAAPIGSTVRGNQVVMASGPRPQVVTYGSGAAAGNNSPRRR